MVVVIPTVGNPDLGVLLMQLQQQREKPRIVYIADNSANGEGLRIARRYHFDTTIPFVIQRNVGPIHKSWNTGIKFAKEDDVVILNDDCLVSWDFIDTFSAYAKSGGAMMYCPDNAGFPPVTKVRPGYDWYSKTELSYRLLGEQEYILPPSITGWCMVIPHDTIKRVGMFDESFKLYFGDKDYEARMFKKGGQVAFIKGLNVQHFGSSSTVTQPSNKIQNFYKHDEAFYKQKYNLK